MKLALVNYWQFPVNTPHFGLISLAAYIRERFPDLKIKIFEGIDPSQELRRFQPNLVGFTSDTLTYGKTVGMAKKLRRKLKASFIIGGVHITALPESLDPVFDLAVVGEGEQTLAELLKVFQLRKFKLSQKDLVKIPGLVYRGNKKIYKTPSRTLIKNIDALPYPARDLVPMEKRYLKDQLNLFGVKRLVTLMTSRGCPYHCVFCGSPVQWGGVRFHSPEYVLGEIKKLVNDYQADGIMFWDDLFTAPEARIIKLVKLIKEERLNEKLTFFGYARANLINEKMCRLLKSINVKRLIFGLESGSEIILSFLKQHSVTVADNKKAVELCRKYGITTSSGYITGTPGETLKDLRLTYDFMKEHPLDNSQIYILTPYPGTKIWAAAEKEGLVSPTMDFGKLFVQLPAVKFKDLFRSDYRYLIKGRIFLNSKKKENLAYFRLVFRMMLLAFWQNLVFYLKVAPKNLGLVIRYLSK